MKVVSRKEVGPGVYLEKLECGHGLMLESKESEDRVCKHCKDNQEGSDDGND